MYAAHQKAKLESERAEERARKEFAAEERRITARLGKGAAQRRRDEERAAHGACAAMYRPEARELLIEYELPRQNVVPAVAAYRYLKTKDIIQSVQRAFDQDFAVRMLLRSAHL